MSIFRIFHFFASSFQQKACITIIKSTKNIDYDRELSPLNYKRAMWESSMIWLSSRRANWWLEFYWCRRVECIKIVIMIIMCNNSVWLMCCHWWHIRYRSFLAILRKKVGKPKEEIRNLYGFHMNSFNKWIHMYKSIFMNSFVLWIHLIRVYLLHCP